MNWTRENTIKLRDLLERVEDVNGRIVKHVEMYLRMSCDGALCVRLEEMSESERLALRDEWNVLENERQECVVALAEFLRQWPRVRNTELAAELVAQIFLVAARNSALSDIVEAPLDDAEEDGRVWVN